MAFFELPVPPEMAEAIDRQRAEQELLRRERLRFVMELSKDQLAHFNTFMFNIKCDEEPDKLAAFWQGFSFALLVERHQADLDDMTL